MLWSLWRIILYLEKSVLKTVKLRKTIKRVHNVFLMYMIVEFKFENNEEFYGVQMLD